MTTLTPEMERLLPELERRTGMCVSDLLRLGLVKVYREVWGTGQVTVQPMPEAN
ncbi:MAG: hypothetical protein JNJ83_11135 [Verrucomicrobiaceae bacterium]|nr:hypothetical protein [Verrucomicrobiaceae bacterium]